MKVLIGFDGSECAEAALHDLRLAGLPEDVEAVVLTVANVWLPPEPAPGVELAVKVTPQAVTRARKEAEDQVAEAHRVAARGVSLLRELFPLWSIRAEAVADSPGWAIIGMAREWEADLVVVGATGRSGFDRVALGSVSQKVVTESPCSVRVARNTGRTSEQPPRILIALDGSENSERLIDAIVQRQWPAGTQVRLLTAVDEKITTAIFEPPAHLRNWLDASDEDPLAWVARMLASYRTRLENHALLVDTLVNHGDPRKLLLDEAENWPADSIMIGAKGHRFLERVMIGSVSTSITARALCSVEVVR